MTFPSYPSPKIYCRHLHRSSPHAHQTSLVAAHAPPPSPPNGAGTAAPTRGDRFLGRQLATEAVARVLTLEDADKCHRRKEKRRALAWKPSDLASCYGCGASLDGGGGRTGIGRM